MKEPIYNRFIQSLRIPHVCINCGELIEAKSPARYRVADNNEYEYIHVDGCDFSFIETEETPLFAYNPDLKPIENISEIDILIPTMKDYSELEKQILSIKENTKTPCNIIFSGLKASASINRNHCLGKSKNEIGIMLDDDMEGFFPGWDKILIDPFYFDSLLMVISARLLNLEGKAGSNCADNYDMDSEYVYVQKKHNSLLPTAAVAFRNIGIKFDEKYIGSGFEDSDWFFQYCRLNNKFKYMINNKCKLVHRNEMKNQHGKYWEFNSNYFTDKWYKNKTNEINIPRSQNKKTKVLKKLSVATLIKTFSGEEWVRPCLKSLYDYVDKIVLVNSDTSWTGEKGNSTRNEIANFRSKEDKDNKIIEIECDTANQIQQCDVGFKYIKDNGYDFAMIVDFDEIWDQVNLKKALDALNLSRHFAGAMLCGMRTYIKYPIYRINPPEPSSPTVFVSTKQLKLGSIRGLGIHPRIKMKDIFFHHFNFVRRKMSDIERKYIASPHSEKTHTHIDYAVWKQMWDKLPEGENLQPTIGYQHLWRSVKVIKPKELPLEVREMADDNWGK